MILNGQKSELQQITRAVIAHAMIDARRQFPLQRNHNEYTMKQLHSLFDDVWRLV